MTSAHAIELKTRFADAAAIPFVGEFDHEIRLALLNEAHTKSFGKGERILEAGELPDRLCVVLSGMVELCGTTENLDCGVLLLAEGDLIFPMAVLYQEPCLTAATALTETQLLMLSRQAVFEQAASNTKVAMALARIMGGQWRMALRHIIDLRSRSAAKRLAAFLLKFYDYSDERPVRLPFSRATLAARLGISRETLSRVIQVVARNGLVLRGSEVLILDRSKAEEFRGPEPYARRGERRLKVHAL